MLPGIIIGKIRDDWEDLRCLGRFGRFGKIWDGWEDLGRLGSTATDYSYCLLLCHLGGGPHAN